MAETAPAEIVVVGKAPAETFAVLGREGEAAHLEALPEGGERAAVLAQARALVVGDGVPVDAALLADAPRLEALGVLGLRLDRIDLDACRERKVAVCTAEGAFDTAIVEYVLAAALVLVREVFVTEGGRGGELQGRTLGLFGLDRTARQVAYAARGMGVRIIGFDPRAKPGEPVWTDIEPRTREDLIAEADVLSLHPQDQDPAYRLGPKDIARLKPHAVVIDASPYGAVDEPALRQALDAGSLAGAALDRPGPTAANLLRTDGAAPRTRGAEARVGRLVARKVRAVLSNRR